jgi:hypothetical protein
MVFRFELLASLLLVLCASASCGGSVDGATEDSGHDSGQGGGREGGHEGGMDTGSGKETGPGDAGIADGSPKEAGPPIALALSGCYTAHTVPVTIGGSQVFALNVDTGSSTLGVAAQGCTECAEAGVTPLYVPGTGATDLHKTVDALYGGGELGWTGEAYEDTVSIGGLGAPVDFGAMTTQLSYFFPDLCDAPDGGTVPAPYQGIVGFAPDMELLPGTNEYYDQVVHAGLTPDVFAIELCHVGGTMWFGGYDPAATTGPMQYTPMGTSDGYTVGWTSLTVGPTSTGVSVPLPATTQATLDSGGQEIIVPDATFQAIANALDADPGVVAQLGAAWLSSTAESFVNCVLLDESPAALDALLPSLTLTFGTVKPIQVTLTATQSYLGYSYGSGSQVEYCQTLVDGVALELPDLFYLGQSLMMGNVVVHDRAHGMLGIAPGKPCAY